jgi:hypothetical protein
MMQHYYTTLCPTAQRPEDRLPPLCWRTDVVVHIFFYQSILPRQRLHSGNGPGFSLAIQAGQSLSQGIQGRLRAIRQVQLGQDVGDVSAHRALAQHQDIGNLLVR